MGDVIDGLRVIADHHDEVADDVGPGLGEWHTRLQAYATDAIAEIARLRAQVLKYAARLAATRLAATRREGAEQRAPERDEETALRQWREREAFGHVSRATEQQLDDAAPKPCATCGGYGAIGGHGCGEDVEPCPDCAGESGDSDA